MKWSRGLVAALCCMLLVFVSLPASAADVAWVSFHSADDMPSTAAATAGFTNAPDIGYTTALAGAGHNVTRVLTHGQPFTPEETDALNAFDLVIVSRSVPSGNFQDADETVFWNASITAPVMHMGAYGLRNSRLGMYTGGTIPDSVGPVHLTVNNPSHPIFDGIALDGSNMTVNPYADSVDASSLLPAPNNVVQRGISIVTDPIIAGGHVLATAPVMTGDPPMEVAGTVIAYFPPGLTTADGTPDVLGGHRLIFLSGSRENSGLTSEGSGIYDLSQDGGAMFLNAVDFMLAVPEPASATLLLLAIAGFGMLRKR